MSSLNLAEVPKTGSFIVAVSGGVDSTVLLHVLKHQRPELRIVVAHVEHGIRADESKADAAFVGQLAGRHGYRYELLEAGLGASASEELARTHRYAFLHRLCKKYEAVGIMTAHHQDDLLETVILNIMRGTGWRGLCSLRSTPQLLRPLLGYPKAQLVAYARQERIAWRHDATNDSTDYTRNRIRHQLMPQLSLTERDRLLRLAAEQARLRLSIEGQAEQAYGEAVIFEHEGWVELSRYFLAMVPATVACEVLRIAALRSGGCSLLHAQLEHLRVFALVAKPGGRMQPGGGLHARATKRGLVVGRG